MTQPSLDQRNDYGSIEQSGGISSTGSTYFHSTINNSISGPSPQVSQTAARRDLLRKLGPVHPASEKARILHGKDPLLTDSCDWVFKDAAFQAWLGTSPDSSILWIHGNPGKGKTMIAAAAIDKLAVRASNAPLAFFFCQRGDKRLDNACAVLRGLLYSLIKHESVDSLALHDCVAEGLAAGQFWELWTALETVLSTLNFPIVYVVIDALDECSDKSKDLLECIVRYQRKSSVRWLITSRNEPYIQERLEYDNSAGVHMSLEINAGAVRLTVMRYIDWKVSELERRKKYSTALSAEVNEYLRDNSEGTFLWVALVAQELSKVGLAYTKAKLYQFPPGLVPLYDHMLVSVESIDDQATRELCLQLLRTVELAFRPLSPQGLAMLCDLPKNSLKRSVFAQELISQCGSFLQIQENYSVAFVHQSSSDFFRDGKGKRIFPQGMPAAHLHMSEACMRAMSASLKRNICGFAELNTPIWHLDREYIKKRIPSWLRYACRYFLMHYTVSTRLIESHFISGESNMNEEQFFAELDQKHLDFFREHLAFFQKHFMHWLEILIVTDGSSLRKAGGFGGPSDVLDVARKIMWPEHPKLPWRRLDNVPDRGVDLAEFDTAPLQLYVGLIASEASDGLINQNFHRELPSWLAAPIATLEQQQMSLGDDGSVVLQFSPDGKLVACISSNGHRKIYLSANGELLTEIPKTTATQDHALAFAPKGDRVFTLQLSYTGKRRLLRSTKRYTQIDVWSIAKAGRAGTHSERLWTENLRAIYEKSQIAIHPTEEVLAFAQPDGKVVLRRWKDGAKTIVFDDEIKVELPEDQGLILGLTACFSPDGNMLVAEGEACLRLLHLETSEKYRFRLAHVSQPNQIAFSSDSKFVAIGNIQGDFNIWNVRSHAALSVRLPGHRFDTLDFRPGGGLTLVTCEDQRISLWTFREDSFRHPFGEECMERDWPRMNAQNHQRSGIDEMDHMSSSQASSPQPLAEILDTDEFDHEIRPPLWSETGKLITCGEIAISERTLAAAEYHEMRSFFCLDGSRTWITAQGKPIVRLPFHARSWAMHGSTIVVAGHRDDLSGGLRFYNLDECKYLEAQSRHPSGLW